MAFVSVQGTEKQVYRPRGRAAASFPFSAIAAYSACAFSFGFTAALVLGLVP